MVARLKHIARGALLAGSLCGGALAETAAPDPARPVALIADEITYNEETGVLTASGDVELYQDGRTLTASAIRYDSNSERIAAEGPIVLRTPKGETVYADGADLDPELRDGLVQGARLAIAGGGKIAAAEAERIDDRYDVLEKAVFSPCEVCAANPVPLWRIRADRIVHDQEERRIHYENAWFDVVGVPIGFLPYFRHPSPEVERATGLLAPSVGHDRSYGAYVKAPYFIVLDDQSDLTLTPFLMSEDGAILETEYRRLFRRGSLNLDLKFGATDYGDSRSFRGRAGGFGEGRYQVADGVLAGFDLAFSSDDPFMRRYDFTDQDRLTTDVFLRAYDGRDRASIEGAFLQSLRAREPQDEIPFVIPEISARRVWDAPGIGGEMGLQLDTSGLTRIDGRDVGRLSLGADWSRQTILPVGLVLRGFADARADFYQTEDDPKFDGGAARMLPRVGAEARMPFVRADESGRSHVVEPIIQFNVAPDVNNDDIPNEDSVIVEFDEMNLFETDRATGFDRPETGVNVTVGARYEMIDDDGLGFRVSGGRVFRLDDSFDFPGRPGLEGDVSDYVAAASATYGDWLQVGTRWRLSNGFSVNQAEAGGRIDYDPFSLYGYYLFIESDPAERAFKDRSEVNLGGAVQFDPNWKLGGEAQRDLIEENFVSADGVLTYEDECAGLDFYVRQQFAESDDSPGGTTVGVRVRLFGAGARDQAKATGLCAFGAK